MNTSLTLANNSFRLNSGTGRRIAALVLAILMISALMMTTAFASTTETAQNAIVKGINEGMESVFKVLKVIVTPIAAIVFAASGLKMLFGGERGVESAKKTMLISAIAIALVWLAPAIVKAVSDWFSGVGDGGAFSGSITG